MNVNQAGPSDILNPFEIYNLNINQLTTGAAATFNLVFNGQTTANLASNTTPAAVQCSCRR